MEDNKYTHENVLIHPKAVGNIISEISGRTIANCNTVSSNVTDEYLVNAANAERIVKCWNEYDKLKEERDLLLDSLEDMVNDYEKYKGLINTRWLHPYYHKAKDLLNNIQK